MYGRFYRKSTKAINISQNMAIELGHNYVGTEHLLLGLGKRRKWSRRAGLQSQGVTEEKVIREIEELIGRGEMMGQPLDFTPRTKRVLELSYREARRMGHNYIGTEHLL